MSTKINDKILSKVSKRWIIGSQLSWNYERMMGGGYLYSILPFLKENYGDKSEEYYEMVDTHSQFFNTTPHMGGFILGMDMATEEVEGLKAKEAITSLKTGLMGSFAGVGDTIFGVLFPTVFGSVASYMALKGNSIGLILWIIVNLGLLVFRYYSVGIGYKQGLKLVDTMSGRMKALTHSATLLGVTVIGAMIPSVINAKITWVFTSGKVKLNVQDTLDQIMPMLIPAIIVAIVYWLLGKKAFNSTRVIMLVIIFSIIMRLLQVM
ncbi:PTS system mannose/fructose/sorbose family transporter subunit IID [Atopobacter sp. AH10]|nr:PTS system mannose/fructose/sorbose family transporter subunit IID [Atopobacter sp. AH10]